MTGLRMNIGLILALVAAVGFAIFLFRTYGGLPAAGRRSGASGGPLRRLLVAQGAVDGAAAFGRRGRAWRVRWKWLARIGQLTPYVPLGYGFAAIIVAFVGRLHPVGIDPLGHLDEHVLHRRRAGADRAWACPRP